MSRYGKKTGKKPILFFKKIFRRKTAPQSGGIEEFHRANLLVQQGRFIEAEKTFQQAYRQGCTGPVWHHYYGSLLDRMDRPVSEVLAVWEEAVAVQHSGQLAIFSDIIMRLIFRGDRKEADRWVQKATEAYRSSLGTEPFPKRYILQDYTSVIGHLCNLDFYIKARLLGWKDPSIRPVLVKQPGLVNPCLFEYWAEHLPVLEIDSRSSVNLETMNSQQEPMGFNVFKHASYHFWETWHKVQGRWEQEGRKPLLKLREDHLAEGRRLLREHFPEALTKWYVCIHAREEGFHSDQAGLYKTTRNADIATYQQAVEKIQAAGGKVIRLGDASMRPFQMAGVWDYAKSTAKSPLMDVFLSASCRFYLGSASGLCHVPPLFGTPVALTNWVPLGLRSSYKADRFIPKRYRWKTSGKLFSLREMMNPPYHHWQFPGFFEKAGIAVEDNTAEEIGDLAEDMLDSSLEISPEQQEFEALCRQEPICYGRSPIGQTFIKKNRALLK